LARSRRYRAKKMPSVPQTEAGANPSARTAPAAPPAPLRAYYDALLAAHGPQHWWPGRSAFEVIVGAILTQNTSWTNVEPAIRNLRREKLLTPRGMESVSLARLARLIRSSGYFRQKARKLKCFVQFLRSEYGGSLAKMFRTPTVALLEKLEDEIDSQSYDERLKREFDDPDDCAIDGKRFCLRRSIAQRTSWHCRRTWSHFR